MNAAWASAGCAEQVPEPDRPDPPGAEVLVAIQPRAPLGARVVEVDHDQAIEPDPRVEVVEEGIDDGRIAEVDAGTPGVGRVEAEPQSVPRRRRRVPRHRRWPPARHVRAEPPAAARPSSRGRASPRPARRRPRPASSRTPSATRSMPVVDAAVAVRPDVDVDEPRPERRGAAQLAGEDVDGRSRRTPGPGRPGCTGRRRGWRPAGCRAGSAARRSPRSSTGGSARRRHAVGLSVQICIAVAPISCGAFDRLDHPRAERQVGTEPSVIGWHRGASYDARPWTS